MTTTYPIKLRFKRSVLEELHSCEYGSYEDNVGGADGRAEEYADGRLHIVEIIDRGGKTVVELRDQHEVDEFFAQAVSGTFGLHHAGVCQRIFDDLLPHVSDAVPAWIRRAPMIGY